MTSNLEVATAIAAAHDVQTRAPGVGAGATAAAAKTSPTVSPLAAHVADLRAVVGGLESSIEAKRDAVLALMTIARERGPELRSERILAAKIELSKAEHALNLQRADFSGADLRWGVFVGIDLQEANFAGARLYRTSLRDTNLRWSKFDGADCSGTNFQDARLRGASFKDANLTKANFRSVDLSQVLHLTSDQVSKACWDQTTVLPPEVTTSISDCDLVTP